MNELQVRNVGRTEPHVGRLAEEWVSRHGDYPAVWFEGRWWGSAEMLEFSGRIAGGLLALGIEAGDRIVITMPNRPEVPVLYHAVWRAGAVVTPAMFLLTEADLRHVIADAGARVVITTSDLLSRAESAVEGLGHVQHIVSVGTASGSELSLEALAQAAPTALVPRSGGDLAALLYTGGTTGRSKGVALSHANLAMAGQLGGEFEAGRDLRRELVALPLSHSFGLMVTLTAMCTDDPKSWVLIRKFSSRPALELIEEHRINAVQVVPAMIQLLLSEPIEQFDTSSLHSVQCGGAPLAANTITEFKSRVPTATIIEGYGLTETATVLTANPPGAEKIRSVGLPAPGVDVRIIGADGEPLEQGQVGEICCRSATVMLGYWNAPELTAEAVRDGWLHTGDIGYLDADGYLFILDRKKDLIIRGGFNVYPGDIEDALMRHPLVRMAAVLGKPDPLHGEEVVAFVEPKPGAAPAPAELVGWARENIGGYKYPREVHVVESLPLTDIGKVDRKALRRRLGLAEQPGLTHHN
jgi:long-chain acyl-CoA synthetase